MEEIAQAIEVKPRRERGTGRIWQIGRLWWIQYYVHGRQIRESSHSEKKGVADRLLLRRLGEREAGLLPNPKVEKILVEELAQEFLRDYRNNERKSLAWAERCWIKHLKPRFGNMRAAYVSTDDINRHIEARRNADAQNGTINRELACLKRIFNLAYRSTPRKVQNVPVFPEHLKENPPRRGFVEDEQYAKLCKACDALWLRAMLAAGYSFGFRKGELLTMRVRQVNLLEETLRLDPGTTKNNEGRTVKMTGEVYALISECVRSKGPEDFVFTWPNGKPVRDFRGSWEKLCKAAGLPGLLVHDLRRSAVRNMIRKGIPERVAMAISGHKTASVFARYDIVSGSDLAEAARKIEGKDFGARTGQTAENGDVEKKKQLPV